MPWKSAFWYTRRQKRALRSLAKQCDLIATNLGYHASWLEREAMQGVTTPLQKLPMFSNVGESLALPLMRARRPVMAVFGLPESKKRSYRCLSHLGSMLNVLGVEEILDIGWNAMLPQTWEEFQ